MNPLSKWSFVTVEVGDHNDNDDDDDDDDDVNDELSCL